MTRPSLVAEKMWSSFHGLQHTQVTCKEGNERKHFADIRAVHLKEMRQHLALNTLPQALALIHVSGMIHLPNPHITVATGDGQPLISCSYIQSRIIENTNARNRIIIDLKMETCAQTSELCGTSAATVVSNLNEMYKRGKGSRRDKA